MLRRSTSVSPSHAQSLRDSATVANAPLQVTPKLAHSLVRIAMATNTTRTSRMSFPVCFNQCRRLIQTLTNDLQSPHALDRLQGPRMGPVRGHFCYTVDNSLTAIHRSHIEPGWYTMSRPFERCTTLLTTLQARMDVVHDTNPTKQGSDCTVKSPRVGTQGAQAKSDGDEELIQALQHVSWFGRTMSKGRLLIHSTTVSRAR